MNIGIIKNKDCSYEYLFLINNKIHSIHIDKYGIRKSNTEYLKNIYKTIFNKEKYNYINNYLDYNIYYDKENKLKHFIKNNQENYNLFYKLNGYDAILYKNNNISNATKKIFIAGIEILLIVSINFINIIDKIQTNQIEYKENDLYNSIQEVQYNRINYKEAIKIISECNIDDEMKKYLCNEELLSDIFFYYNDTPLEYSIKFKLDNLKVNYYAPQDTDENEITGYYNLNTPGIINISKKYKTNKEMNKHILVHEYNHLFQAEGCEYNYLLEAWAELMSKEYFNTEIISYSQGVKNLMLLIDIIGSKPLFELFYSNSNETLENILKQNLSNKDYQILTNSFKNSTLATGHQQENKEIRLILCKLYENINKQSIYKDENILYELVYEDNILPCNDVKKYYINYRKMQENEIIEFSNINEQTLKSFLKNNNISSNDYKYNNRILTVYIKSIKKRFENQYKEMIDRKYNDNYNLYLT